MKTSNFNSPTISTETVLSASDQHQLVVSNSLSADQMQYFFPLILVNSGSYALVYSLVLRKQLTKIHRYCYQEDRKSVV